MCLAQAMDRKCPPLHEGQCPLADASCMSIVTFLTPFSTSPMTDMAVDSLSALFLAYCTLRDTDDEISIDDRIMPQPSALDPTPLYSPD